MGARQGHTASQGSKYFSVSLHPHGDPGPHQPSPAQSCLAPLHPLPPCPALLISASPVLSTQPSSARPSRRMPAIAHKSVFRKLSSERGPHMPLALCLGRRAVEQAVLPGMASSALWSLEAGLCLWDASLSLTLSSAAGQVAPWLQDSGLQGMGSGGQPGHLAASPSSALLGLVNMILDISFAQTYHVEVDAENPWSPRPGLYQHLPGRSLCLSMPQFT